MSSVDWSSECLIETPSGKLKIQALSDTDQFERVVDLQKEIWGYGVPGGDDPYPARALFALAKSGGLVALAVLEDKPVGFSAAWLGMDPSVDRHYLHSQLVGVLPGHRHLSIGYRLKLYQRDFALHRGLDLVRWTFDPLLSTNANLNLRKLGVVAQLYVPDFYGGLLDRFRAGTGSDRLWADWYINSPRVGARLQAPVQPLKDLPPFLRVTSVRDEGAPESWRRLEGYQTDGREDDLLVEIPDNFDTLRREHREEALRWREGIRTLLRQYFSRGYRIADFLVLEGQPRRHFYHLTNRPLQSLLGQD